MSEITDYVKNTTNDAKNTTGGDKVTPSWDELKQQGSRHYKTGSVEPVDLYRSGMMFHDFALCSIIKYAFRSRLCMDIDKETLGKNLDKIIDYAQKLKAAEVTDDEKENS